MFSRKTIAHVRPIIYVYNSTDEFLVYTERYKRSAGFNGSYFKALQRTKDTLCYWFYAERYSAATFHSVHEALQRIATT